MADLIHYAFFREALLACLLGGAGLGMIGVCLVLMDIPFLGISMSHAAFLGAVTGLLIGVHPLVGALAASALAGLTVGPLADRARTSSNTALAIVFSATMGLALLLLTRIPGPKSEALNLIWGSVLTISRAELWFLAALCGVTFLLIGAFFKEVRAVIFDRDIAAAAGVRAGMFHVGLILLAGLVISASLDIVGGLLVFALIVNPAGAASQVTCRLSRMFALSALFGMISCGAGLAISYWLDAPPGAVIALTACAIFMIAFIASPKRSRNRPDGKKRGSG